MTKIADAVMVEQMQWEEAMLAFSDWRPKAKEFAVLKRLQRHDKPALLVRIVTQHSFPTSMVVDEASGRVLEQYRVANTPGLGAIGSVTVFKDFGPVDGAPGVLLHGSSVTTYVTPLLGVATVKYDSVEVMEDANVEELFAPDAP